MKTNINAINFFERAAHKKANQRETLECKR